MLAGLTGLLLFGALYASSPLLHDTDAAYHLQIASRYAGGDWSELELARPGLPAEPFGDGEVLFHVLLIPFAQTADPIVGGRVFLALLDALILATIGALATRLVGRWGWLVPVALIIGSAEFARGLATLQPELLSMVLILLASAAAAGRQPRLLGAIAFAYVLSHAAWPAFLALCFIWFLLFGWLRREWSPLAVAYPLAGIALGLLVHPQFPTNLAFAEPPTFGFFRLAALMDIETALRPNSTAVALLANLGVWLGMICLWRSRVRDAWATARAERRAEHAAIAYGAAAAVFGVLYLLMSPFSNYFVPCAVLAWLALIHARGERVSHRVTLAPGRTLRLGVVLGVIALVSLPALVREVRSYQAAAETKVGGMPTVANR